MVTGLIVLLLVLGGALLLWQRRGKPTAPQRRAPAAAGPATPAARDAVPPGTLATPAPELQLADARFVRADQLDEARRQALQQELRSIPRPPQALHQLVSPAFLAQASSTALAELVMGEPMVAAKVMAMVNSPLYGARNNITSIGQAITFLGLNCVRGLALQYLLNEALPSHDPRLRRAFDTLSRTSAIATELCLHLAKRAQLPDAPAMATQLVLANLGRLTAAVLTLRGQGDAAALDEDGGLLQRVAAEQARLGLSSGELGYLLMQAWELPGPLATDTRDIGRIAFAGAPAGDQARAARLALCALSLVLGERIARGALRDLGDYDFAHDLDEDLRALRRHLPIPMAQQVHEALRAPELARLTA